MKLFRVKVAADRTGVNRTTLLAAMDRGEIAFATTGCGLRLVGMEQVEKWNRNRPKRGRPSYRVQDGQPPA